ncbi:MAG: hypothetical protein JSU68_06815, partial [Phycisphaerales bacterium]
GKAEEGAVGSVVGATLGLLAFMLAFTFGMAASRRESRRELLLEEVNAIGTTFLRTDLISEPHRTEARRLLRKYVDLRLDVYGHPEKLPETLKESEKLQEQLWQHAAALADADLKNPDIVSLFVDSLNETIDLQTKRVVVGRYRIPTIIWSVFCLLTILSMAAVGYHFGQSGKGNFLVHLVLALSFSVVVFLIADLDRAAEGWLKVSNQPMMELRQQLER